MSVRYKSNKIKLTGMTEDNTARAFTSCTATSLHRLLHVGDKIPELNLEVLVLKIGQLLANLFLVRAALDQDILEAGVGKCAKELWGGNFVQKLLEDHSSTTCDNGHAARLTSSRRHTPGKMIDGIADRKSPIPELNDEAEGDREDLSMAQADDQIEEGADEINKLREGGDVFSEGNSLIKHATKSDDPDDGLAEDDGQKDQGLKICRVSQFSSENRSIGILLFWKGRGQIAFALKAQRFQRFGKI